MIYTNDHCPAHVHVLEGPAAGGIRIELSRRTDRFARELRIFLAASEPRGPITAISCSTVLCGIEGNSRRFLKVNLRRRMRVGRRRWRVDPLHGRLATIPGAV